MQTNSTFAIIFFTRKSRSNIKKLTIYARITVNGKRSEISLKRSISVCNWDASKGRARGATQNIRLLNIDLRYIQELLGHSKPETTMLYTHVSKKDLLNIESPLDVALKKLVDKDKNGNNIWLSENY